MVANSNSGDGTKLNFDDELECDDRIKLLYPGVNEEQTPLPRFWNPKDKHQNISLSEDNLEIHYAGNYIVCGRLTFPINRLIIKLMISGFGKTHLDAGSIRATHPIPQSCGLYYFEVLILDKGCDNYIGIGLSQKGVNLNGLPGIYFI